MGYFTDLYDSAINNVKTVYAQKENAISGATAGAEREQAANEAVAANKGGYLNSPLYQTMLRKNTAAFTGEKNKALASLATSQAQDINNLTLAKGNAALQDKTADNTFWGNMASGAGSLIGSALTLFGGPAGIAAGIGLNAAGNLAKGGMEAGQAAAAAAGAASKSGMTNIKL